MMRKIHGIFVMAAVLLALTASCGSDKDEEKTANTPDAITSATPQGVAELASDHPGWKKPNCLSCHENPHKNDLTVMGCVTCHGSNGATLRPAGHGNKECTTCHDNAHDGLSVLVPDGCTSCHKYDTSTSECPVTEEYDAVIVGAGGGGLGAAATLALAGKKVIVIERHNKVGGYMTNFKRGPYTFEISLHAMGGLDENGGTRTIFQNWGILDKLKPIKLDPAYKVVYPGGEILVPADDQQYENDLKARFPEDADNIGKLFTYLRETQVFFKQLAAAQNEGGKVWDDFFAAHTADVLKLFGTMNQTLDSFLEDYFTNPELHLIFTQLAAYLGASPGEVQAAFFLVMWFGYTFEGYYYFEGGSQSISDALHGVIEEHGGVVKLNTTVEKIVVEDGAVKEVRTKNDACYRAPLVISNANANATLLNMVGADKLPANYVEKLEKMPIGVSAMVLYMGVDKDYREFFQGAHEVFINESLDQEKNYEYFYTNNTELSPFLLTNYSVLVPTVAPEGHNVLILAVYLDYEWNDVWQFYKDREAYETFKSEVARKYIARSEKFLPGLSEHIRSLSIATPPTLERFTLNTKGTFYGFHNLPKYALLNRLAQETPIKGLYLAGQWTFPGPGQSAVLQSGLSAAKKAMKAQEEENTESEGDGDAESVTE